jgi:3-hydroxyisobutyrate dehydrogenase-like beta-hydroxyacid dehydrogenase
LGRGTVAFVTARQIAIFGLGEAGSLIAADLARAGARVRAFDPADVPTPAGVGRRATPADAVVDAEVVLAIVGAADAPTAASQALEAIPDGAIYADLGTGSADLKRELARTVEPELRFVDVAMMAIVPGHGLGVPSLASGAAADDFAATMNPLGARIEAIGPEPGVAATRKLLRSVVTKGLAGLIIEAMQAAGAAGEAEWVWDNIVQQLTVVDEAFVRRMVEGTSVHHERRRHEMEASAALLRELGVEPLMTRGTVEHLVRVASEPLPEIPS